MRNLKFILFEYLFSNAYTKTETAVLPCCSTTQLTKKFQRHFVACNHAADNTDLFPLCRLN